MNNPYARQSLAEDVKREVLAELNQGKYKELNLVNDIKWEVLKELEQYRHKQSILPDWALIEAIKKEVLASIRGERQGSNIYSEPYYLDRSQIDTIKREVITQIESGREIQGESHESGQEEVQRQHNNRPDQNLVQAVKDSVIADLKPHNYR